METLGGWGPGGGYSRLEWGGEQEGRRGWPVPVPQPRPDDASLYKTMPEIPMVYSSQQQTLRDSPKKGLEAAAGGAAAPPAAPPLDRREEDPPAPPSPLDTTARTKLLHKEKVLTYLPRALASTGGNDTTDPENQPPPPPS